MSTIPPFDAAVRQGAKKYTGRPGAPTLGDYAGRGFRKARQVAGAVFGRGSSVDPRFADIIAAGDHPIEQDDPSGTQTLTPMRDARYQSPPPLAPPPGAAPAAPAPAAPAADPTRPVSAAASAAPPVPQGAAAGPETAMTADAAGNEGEERPKTAPSTYHDRVKAVKLPSGKIVFTNVQEEYSGTGARGVNYDEAMEKVTGRPYKGANVFEGPEGAVYSQPGQEAAVGRAMDKWAPPPSLEASLPETHDTVALTERRMWLDQQGAQEMAKRSAGAQVATEEATAAQRIAQAQMDPMELARLEAESKYGGQMIESEQKASETGMAVRLIAQITDRQNRLRASLPPNATPEQRAALAADINQLEQDKKLYLIAVRPQAAPGLTRPDPYPMFGGGAGEDATTTK